MNSFPTDAPVTSIPLPTKLAWQASVDARIKLYRTVKVDKIQNVVLDFSQVKNVYPNGIVPIIALVDQYKEEGTLFDLIPPNQTDVKDRFVRNGWLHFIRPDSWPIDVNNTDSEFILRRFTSDKSLNDAVNDVIAIFLQQFIFAEGVPQAFEWALNEIAGNVLEHARAVSGWIQVIAYPGTGSLALIVCDSGRGVLRSMKRKHKIKTDVQALELAIQKGVSGIEDSARGNGLAGAVAIAKHSKGLFVLVSGRGRIKLFENGIMEANEGRNYFGTCVEMQFAGKTKIGKH